MKQFFWFTIILVVSVCGASCKKQIADQPAITVTIQPQAYFLEQLVGDKFAVEVLVPSGSSPESYDPSPAQIVSLSKSKALFLVGKLGFELAWKDRIQSNNPHLILFDTSQGIESFGGGHTCSEHDHDHGGDLAHFEHAGADPHIWSSPKTVLKMIDNMYAALVELDEVNKDYYSERYQKLRAEVEAFDRECAERLSHLEQRAFMIYHPSLGYLANDYGLTQLPIEFEGKEPTPKHLKLLTETARAHGVKVIFIQPEFDQKNAQVLSEQLGVPTVKINPLAYDWKKELELIIEVLCR